MKLNRRALRIISFALLVIAILEIFQERIGIKIDSTTILIIGLAILVYILPDLSNLSKFKYGDVELEFEREVKKEVDKLEKMVTVEESIDKTTNQTHRQTSVSWQHYYNEYRYPSGKLAGYISGKGDTSVFFQ